VVASSRHKDWLRMAAGSHHYGTFDTFLSLDPDPLVIANHLIRL
jgi:hypothetical protein